MKNINGRKLLVLIAAILLTPAIADAQLIPAFPGAEGAGAGATGGRPVEKLNFYPTPMQPTLEKRGAMYKVTTLDPDPDGVIPGSLRYGLKTENWWYRTHPFVLPDLNVPDSYDVTPRFIVFDVGGTINLGEYDGAPMNVTIAGQTAPGGITIYGGEFNPGHRDLWDTGAQFYPAKTNNMVLRNFAIRTNDAAEKDGLWIAATNSIADHMSMAWYTDEGVSITDSARNLTVQHSIIGPGWNNPDGDGSQIEGSTPQAKISVHHNLYIHNDARIPRLGEKQGPGVETDFRNNVIYNWSGNRAGYSTTSEVGGHEPSFTNFVNNYYIAGANSSSNSAVFNTGNNATRIYQSGNLMDRNFDGEANGTDLEWAGFTGNEIQQAVPYNVPHGVTQPPEEALDTVMKYAGALWWDRDFLDARSIEQLQTFADNDLPVSERGQVLNSIAQDDVDAIANAPMQTRASDWDSDDDGMPDWWEMQHGLNPISDPGTPDWDGDYDGDEYVNLEEYINYIAEWPAPYSIVFSGGTNDRFAQITNWGITQPAPGAAPSTTNWQPSRFDAAEINNGTVVVDAVGQHAGRISLGMNSGDDATLSIAAGWLRVHDEAYGLGNGEIVIGAHAEATATLSLSGGALSVKTLSKGVGGEFEFTGGRLQVDVVNFDLVNDGGTLAPGNSPGSTVINGNFMTNAGALEIELASLELFDSVAVTGDVALGGDLEVWLWGGFEPANGDEFTILTGPSVSGLFDNLTPEGRVSVANSDGTFLVTIGDGQVLLSDFALAAAGLQGDFNDDGIVDAADYTVWRNHLGESDETSINFNGDGDDVGLSDYAFWKEHYGASNSGSGGLAEPGLQNVPEPGTIILLIVGFASLHGGRRCRQ